MVPIVIATKKNNYHILLGLKWALTMSLLFLISKIANVAPLLWIFKVMYLPIFMNLCDEDNDIYSIFCRVSHVPFGISK